MINGIIFSKDRACQCDLTLKSIFENAETLCSKINVLYTASLEEFDRGYSKLKKLWGKQVNFVKQTNFQKDLVSLTTSTEPFTVYFTDDDIFYRKLKKKNSIYIINSPEFACFSLRLGTNTYIQDPYRGIHTTFPAFNSWHDEVLYWDWIQEQLHTNFAYPLSVDGHIFSTNLLLRIIDKFDYDNPNSFEGRLQQFSKNLPNKMACFTKSHVVNTPLNRVQDTCTNLAGQRFPADAKTLNDYWLDDYRPKLKEMDFSNIVGCHQEISLRLTKNEV